MNFRCHDCGAIFAWNLKPPYSFQGGARMENGVMECGFVNGERPRCEKCKKEKNEAVFFGARLGVRSSVSATVLHAVKGN